MFGIAPRGAAWTRPGRSQQGARFNFAPGQGWLGADPRSGVRSAPAHRV